MNRHQIKRVGMVIVILLSLSVSASCTSVTNAGPETISIDTGQIGEIVPGIRSWMAWFEASEHCAGQNKKAELVDLKESVVTYRCVAKD